MSNSPWGAIQHSKQLKRGMRVVSTAGHGGIMVTLRFAEKNLSDVARKRGEVFGGHLCYEEDCDMSIPIYENPDIWGFFTTDEGYLLESLSRWNGDYLVERGIEPVKEYYDSYLKLKERDRLVKEKSPDLIISASATQLNGVVLVYTADSVPHFVEKDDFGKQDRVLKLLSKCKVVEIESLKK